MSPYKSTLHTKRKYTPLYFVGGIVVVLVSFFILRFFVKRHAQVVIPLYPDVVATHTLSRSALIKKTNELQSTLDAYNARLTTLALLENENIALKAELNRDGRLHGTLAHVLTAPNRSLYDTFVIDAGSDDGIFMGQQVYAFGSVALGSISDVSDSSAVVTLFSASGQETVGSAVGDGVAVTLIGRGAGEYEVRMPRDIHFEIGSTIALQSTTPAVLAQVQKIMTDPRDPFQRLLAKVPVNLTTLKWVIVR